MSALEIACEIAKEYEGFRSKPYRCPAGVWTIGYGTTRYPNGIKVTKYDLPISKEQAEGYLIDEMEHSQDKALFYCPILAIDDNKLAAITDFVYNLGPGRLQASTLRRKINQQDWVAAKKELLKWVYADGKILLGLVKRRTVEASLF
jgi:lysozyme